MPKSHHLFKQLYIPFKLSITTELRETWKFHLFQFLKLIVLAMEPTIVPKMEIPSHFSHYRHHTHSPGQGIIFKTREPWSSKSWSYSVFGPQSPSLSDSTLSRLLASFHAVPTRPHTLWGPWCLVPTVAAGFQQLFSTFPSPSYPQQRE